MPDSIDIRIFINSRLLFISILYAFIQFCHNVHKKHYVTQLRVRSYCETLPQWNCALSDNSISKIVVEG